MTYKLQQHDPQPEISVLLLDDDAFDRQRLQRMGAASGLPLCLDAVPTIEDMKKSIDEKTFDVIFLDYQLSNGTGLDALAFIRNHPVQEKAAIVMLTGNARVEIAVTALKGGCSDFLSKDDLTPNLLREAVLGVLPAIDIEPILQPSKEQALDTAMDALISQRMPHMLMSLLECDQLQSKWKDSLSETLETSLHKVLASYDLPKNPLGDPVTLQLAEELNREVAAAILY